MLSKKAANEIALMFNSIDVSEMMQRSVDKKRLDGKITVAQFNEQYAHWGKRALNTARELKARYGIEPVGYRRQLQEAA